MENRSPYQDSFAKRFFKSWVTRFSAVVVVLWVLTAIFADFLASPLPFQVQYAGETYAPYFEPERLVPELDSSLQEVNWYAREPDQYRWSIIPYGTQKNRQQGFFSPLGPQIPKGKAVALTGRFRHWLGTDRAGRDVLALLIHGSRTAFLVAFLAISIATLLGVLIGGIMGYMGDQPWGQSRGVLLGVLLGWIPAVFYGFQIHYYAIADASSTFGALGRILVGILLFFGIMALFVWLGKGLTRFSWFRKPVGLPVDMLVSRGIEILDSIPSLLLIISLSALFNRNLWFVILVMGLVGWTGIARLVRGEVMRIRQMPYIEAARATGLKARTILWQHALPNAFPPVLVILVMGIGGVILTEAALGFLGLIEQTDSWGNLLLKAREDGFSYWWVIVCPGLVIFVVVLSINLLGERLRDVLDPKTSE